MNQDAKSNVYTGRWNLRQKVLCRTCSHGVAREPITTMHPRDALATCDGCGVTIAIRSDVAFCRSVVAHIQALGLEHVKARMECPGATNCLVCITTGHSYHILLSHDDAPWAQVTRGWDWDAEYDEVHDIDTPRDPHELARFLADYIAAHPTWSSVVADSEGGG